MTASPSSIMLSRRAAFRAVAGGAAIAAIAPAALRAGPPSPAAEAAFKAAFEAAADQPPRAAAARIAFLHPDALVVDHDAPFPLSRAGYEDHLRFRMENMQRVETLFHGLESRGHGDTAIVSAYFIERSKPKGGGFRLRAGYCTAVCARTTAGWQALSLHLSPLSAQILDASPG